jgi:hypothetical protein
MAFDRCVVEEPPLFDVGGGQSAACWLAEPGRALPVVGATAGVHASSTTIATTAIEGAS